MAEFGVHGVQVHAGRIQVIGRCYRGPLARGHIFRSLRLEVIQSDTSIRPLHLTVERMMAYRQELDEIDEGMTAELDLSGTGLEAIAAGAVLIT